MTEIDMLTLPRDNDEAGWLNWARIALKYEGVPEALEILGAYLALNTERAQELEEEWSHHARVDYWQQGLEGPADRLERPGGGDEGTVSD